MSQIMKNFFILILYKKMSLFLQKYSIFNVLYRISSFFRKKKIYEWLHKAIANKRKWKKKNVYPQNK